MNPHDLLALTCIDPHYEEVLWDACQLSSFQVPEGLDLESAFVYQGARP